MKEPKEHEDVSADTNKRKLEEDIQLAKHRAQEIVAKLVGSAESKRPRLDYNSSEPASAHLNTSISNPPYSVPFAAQTGQCNVLQTTNKKIAIPNGKVGVIIGRGGETIKYLQLQSGAKIQITRDTEADPYSMTRDVDLTGTQEQVSRAEQLINDTIAQADLGGSVPSADHVIHSTQPGVDLFIMKVPNNKVALVIGKGGETIKTIQSKSGARVQIIPLHLPPGDTSTERNVHINGLQEQIDSAKELINEVISGKRLVNPSSVPNSYMQSAYAPPANWASPGTYLTPPPPPPYYGDYPTQVATWDQSNQSPIPPPSQQNTAYNYYAQQAPPGSAPPNLNYGHHGYDQSYYQQPPNYQQYPSTQPEYPYANPEYGTSSSQSNQPSAGYPYAYPQPGYWAYPSGLAHDQAGYMAQTGSGTEGAVHAPSASHSEQGQSGNFQSDPSEQPRNGAAKEAGYGVEQPVQENSVGNQNDLASPVKENVDSQS